MGRKTQNAKAIAAGWHPPMAWPHEPWRWTPGRVGTRRMNGAYFGTALMVGSLAGSLGPYGGMLERQVENPPPWARERKHRR